MKMYRDTESGEIVSEETIMEEWKADHCGHETFKEYIRCCLSENGFLEEVERMNKEELVKAIENTKTRSAWAKGVKEYALELIEDIEGDDFSEKALLNGASSWKEYSWGGCSLIYDGDIAQRLCTASELKATRHGQRKPNAREEWLDTQARALFQAARMIKSALA